ncbi:MAG TPA: dual specificity protein phosphatase family protein [Pyrinomonadaceae bacterium]|nr:dual specificity protein phosphatase family protein [Pyrinomonadaceae bacterium]
MKQYGLAPVLRRAGVTVALCLLALAAAASPASMSGNTTSGVSIKNFGKVSDRYYRGSQPTEAQVAELKKLGIKTVIDLRKDNVPQEAEWVRSQGMQYFNIPLKASVAATDEQTSYFLGLVNNPANWPVYVHCKGGRHRTGALTAVYRITQDGWTADQAFKEMKEYEFDSGLFGGPMAQKKFVYSYYERHAKATPSSQR